MKRDEKSLAEFRRVLLDSEARRLGIASERRANLVATVIAALFSIAFLFNQLALVVAEIAVPWWLQDFLLFGVATSWPVVFLTTQRLNLLYAFEALETRHVHEAENAQR